LVGRLLCPGRGGVGHRCRVSHRADKAATLAHAVWIENEEGLRFRIPSLEAALANKYGAMLTLTRECKKRTQDALDFAWMVTHSMDEGQQPIDLDKLESLAELVRPGRGGQEMLRLVEMAKQGGVPEV
jgi:hypothetical protein